MSQKMHLSLAIENNRAYHAARKVAAEQCDADKRTAMTLDWDSMRKALNRAERKFQRTLAALATQYGMKGGANG